MTSSYAAKRLYKSRTERMVDGVCGGLAEYFGLDPTLVRIAWVLLAFFGGIGILLYIASMIIMPVNPSTTVANDVNPKATGTNERFWGILLVAVGLFWLLSNLGFSLWHHWWGFSWDVLLPTLLILAGIAFLLGGRSYFSVAASGNESVGDATPEGSPQGPATRPPRLHRSRMERKLFGVCGGLGTYFNIDPTFVRILFVVSAFGSFGITLVLYILMILIVPEESLVATAV